MGRVAEIAVRALEAMDHQDYEELERLIAPDLTLWAGTAELEGIAEIVPMLEAHYAAFPDSVHEFLGTVEEGDRAAIQMRVVATFENPYTTELGTFEPSGEQIFWFSSAFFRVADDRVVEWHAYLDGMAIHRAVGYEPTSGGG